jgi:hypothetical protein
VRAVLVLLLAALVAVFVWTMRAVNELARMARNGEPS